MAFLSGKEKQISELITALKGRNEIPLKFEYLDNGAENWRNLVQSDDYKIGKVESELIQNNIDNIFEIIGNNDVNVLDIGCGDGLDAIDFVKRTTKSYRYFCFDISREMLDLAESNFNKTLKPQIEKYEIDFEEGNFAQITRKIRQQYYKTNLLLLLGHTLGNPSDRNRVLANLRESMVSSDWLLLGIELMDGQLIKEIERHYNLKEVDEFILSVIEKLGIQKSFGHIVSAFNKKRNQMEFNFIFDRGATIKYSDEEVPFEKGEGILLAVSHKFTEDGLRDLLKNSGFLIRKFFLDKENNYCLVLCQPKSHKRILFPLNIIKKAIGIT
jgi:uncharacterized SAM-dependent methyltransferase